MSDYKVLAEVGQSIINVLWEQIQADHDLVALINNASLISLESPATHHENSSDPAARVGLSIPHRRRSVSEKPSSGGGNREAEFEKPPMSLDLYSLITPLLKAPHDQQIVLGKILQILHDRPTLEGPDLAGSLATLPRRSVTSPLLRTAMRGDLSTKQEARCLVLAPTPVEHRLRERQFRIAPD